jgi:hypothetical protein
LFTAKAKSTEFVLLPGGQGTFRFSASQRKAKNSSVFSAAATLSVFEGERAVSLCLDDLISGYLSRSLE